MLEFGVLGPLRVHRDGSTMPGLNAQLVRRLLAALLSRAGDLVLAENLIFALWGEDAPPSARKTLQVYVRRLRAALGEDDRIIHELAGYRIEIANGELDSAEFARLVAAARESGRSDQAVELLQKALGLWRGAAFEDVREHAPLLDEARRLDEERLRVEAEWVGIQLELGRHDEVIPHLTKLTEAHPFREDLREHLMLALYRAGRQTEALELFRCTRKLLDEELGISPGPALSRLHESILRASPELDLAPATSIVPRELPADVGGFVGRKEQLQSLDAMIPNSSPVVISAIAGTAGVGKTALAVHWAHRVASQFPDGQLYLNLNGFSPSAPIRPIEALASMLRSLGVPSEKVPIEEADAAALFRSTVAARQMVIVLDNARSADQVRPLLPGSPGCLVLVTSRNKLGGLVAREGARRLDLDVLSPSEARDLLARILGEDRVRAEHSAIEELALACTYLPLALRIAAANLNDRPHRTVAAHVDELRSGNLLSSLAVEGDEQTAVRRAFDLSYQDIDDPLRSTFRRLGLVPGRDFTVEAIAALAGVEADSHLVRLANAHLIEPVTQDRYTLHDLLRVYAAERAEAEDSESTRAAAVQRLFDWYLARVESAAKQLYPNLIRLPVPAGEVTSHEFDGPTEATAWLDSERQNLVAAIHRAAERRHPEMAWLLAGGMRGYFARRKHLVDWLPAADAALAAALSFGDCRVQAASHLTLAHAYQTRYQYSHAVEHLQEAVKLASEAPWLEMKATCIGNLGGLLYDMGSMDEAAAMVRQSLELSRTIGHHEGEVRALANLGFLLSKTGQLTDAVELLQVAVELYREKGAPASMAIALSGLADALRQLGRLTEARRLLAGVSDLPGTNAFVDAWHLEVKAKICLDNGELATGMDLARRAHRSATQAGDAEVESEALDVMGWLNSAAGDFGAALSHHSEALAIAKSVGNRYAESRALLGMATARNGLTQRDRALVQAREALDLAVCCGFLVLKGQALSLLARLELDRGSQQEARAHAQSALENHRQTGCRLGEAEALMLLAELDTDPLTAVACRSAADDIYAVIQTMSLSGSAQ